MEDGQIQIGGVPVDVADGYLWADAKTETDMFILAEAKFTRAYGTNIFIRIEKDSFTQ